MSYTVIATDHGRQIAVVAASVVDALSIARKAGRPAANVTIFTESGRCVSLAELEILSRRGRNRRGRAARG